MVRNFSAPFRFCNYKTLSNEQTSTTFGHSQPLATFELDKCIYLAIIAYFRIGEDLETVAGPGCAKSGG